jgi:hypothetical protein
MSRYGQQGFVAMVSAVFLAAFMGVMVYAMDIDQAFIAHFSGQRLVDSMALASVNALSESLSTSENQVLACQQMVSAMLLSNSGGDQFALQSCAVTHDPASDVAAYEQLFLVSISLQALHSATVLSASAGQYCLPQNCASGPYHVQLS